MCAPPHPRFCSSGSNWEEPWFIIGAGGVVTDVLARLEVPVEPVRVSL